MIRYLICKMALTLLTRMKMILPFPCIPESPVVCLKCRYVHPEHKDPISVHLMWGTEICGDLNYFSFLITQYVNIFLPCKILKHYLISYDCIQLQAIKNQHLLKQMGVYFSRGTRRNLEAGSMKVQ